MRKRKVEYTDSVRVIMNTADYSKDYRLPRSRAEALFAEGKLTQIICYSNGPDYYSNGKLVK